MIKKLAWWGIAAVAALLFLYPILATVTGSFFSLMDLQRATCGRRAPCCGWSPGPPPWISTI